MTMIADKSLKKFLCGLESGNQEGCKARGGLLVRRWGCPFSVFFFEIGDILTYLNADELESVERKN